MKSILNSILIFGLILTSSIAHAMPDPHGCSAGCFPFTLAGKIQGLPESSAFASFVRNGDSYSVSGYLYNNGTFQLTKIKLDPDPEGGGGGGGVVLDPNPYGSGGGSIVLEPSPEGCASGCDKTTFTLQPSFRADYPGGLTSVTTAPTIKLVFSDQTGEITLNNLQDHFTQLESVQFPSLGLSTATFSETWSPTVTSSQLGLIRMDPNPGAGGPGGSKVSFALSGKIDGVPPNSPLVAFNGSSFSTGGDFYSSGILNFGTLNMEPDPGGSGPGEGMPDNHIKGTPWHNKRR